MTIDDFSEICYNKGMENIPVSRKEVEQRNWLEY
jgi:hypothetical protein